MIIKIGEKRIALRITLKIRKIEKDNKIAGKKKEKHNYVRILELFCDRLIFKSGRRRWICNFRGDLLSGEGEKIQITEGKILITLEGNTMLRGGLRVMFR